MTHNNTLQNNINNRFMYQFINVLKLDKQKKVIDIQQVIKLFI